MMRLDKFLSHQGLGTRKEVKKLIRQGRVRVDGYIQYQEGYLLDETKEHVSLDHEPIAYQRYIYILLHKPKGVICATQDAVHTTVLDLLDGVYTRGLFAVGRLDIDTTGLVLISNDGVLAHQLLSPKRHVVKWYEVGLDGPLRPEQIEKLKAGIALADFTALPAQIKTISETSVLLGIQEGKYHQVKRMMRALGREVLSLKRIAFGPLDLGDLPQGAWRYLNDTEIEQLKSGVKQHDSIGID